MPGWYPDPSGTPGRFRFWDGRGWSQQTSDRPDGPPPGEPGQQRPRRRGPAIILGAVAVVLVLGLIVFLVVGQLDPGSRPFTDEPVPTSTVSGWDDSSPTAPPSSPTPSPSPTPNPSGSETARPLTQCPTGDPRARAAYPTDDRVHGGGLSFPRIRGWQDDLQSSGITWAHDVGSQGHSVVSGWVTLIGVGELRHSDGFTALRQSAEGVMQCVASSSFYRSFESATDLKSEAVRIDGRDAWWIRTDIRVTDRAVPGDTVDVVVVDTGNPQGFGLYFGAVAVGDTDLLRILDDSRAALTVD